MYITDEREDFSDNIIIKKEAAKYLCDNLFKYLFEKFDKADDNWGMNCPDNDKNYLKYNLVMMALSCLGDEGENWDEFAVKRPDGGYFISYATVADDCTKIPEYKYVGCGWMWNQVCRGDKLVLQSKQYNCSIVIENLVGDQINQKIGKICIRIYQVDCDKEENKH